MDLSAIKSMIIEQLQGKLGLDEAKAKGAADIVENLVKEHGASLLTGAAGKMPEGIMDKLPGGIGDAIGGMFGKK